MQALGRRGRLGGQSLTNSQLCYGFVAHAVELVSAADADPAASAAGTHEAATSATKVAAGAGAEEVLEGSG